MMRHIEGDQVGKGLSAVPWGLVTQWSLVALASCVPDEIWDREPRERVGGEGTETARDAALVKLGCGFPSQLL